MLPVLRRDMSSSGRDSAHQVDDAVEQTGRRAFLTLGAAMIGGAAFGTGVAEASEAFPPNDPPWSLSLGPSVADRPYGQPSPFEADAPSVPAPRSLSTNDVCIVAACILNLNGVVDDNSVADRNGLPKLRMPKGGAFPWRDPRSDTHVKECMTDCADPKRVKIQSTAEGKDLAVWTFGPLDEMLAQ